MTAFPRGQAVVAPTGIQSERSLVDFRGAPRQSHRNEKTFEIGEHRKVVCQSIGPSVCDAICRTMRRRVVACMVGRRKRQTTPLKYTSDKRGIRLMSPAMELIGRHDRRGKRQQECRGKSCSVRFGLNRSKPP